MSNTNQNSLAGKLITLQNSVSDAWNLITIMKNNGLKGQTSAFLRSEQARQWFNGNVIVRAADRHMSAAPEMLWRTLETLVTAKRFNKTQVGTKHSGSKSKKKKKTHNTKYGCVSLHVFTHPEINFSVTSLVFISAPTDIPPNVHLWLNEQWSVVKVTVSAEENDHEGGQRSFSRMPQGNFVNQYFLQNDCNVAGSGGWTCTWKVLLNMPFHVGVTMPHHDQQRALKQSHDTTHSCQNYKITFSGQKVGPECLLSRSRVQILEIQ